jgi:KDO2-lipid IV(A) lauroyltransferase
LYRTWVERWGDGVVPVLNLGRVRWFFALMLISFIFRVLARLPLRFMQAVGAALGWLVWLLSPRYRQQMRENLIAAGLPLSVEREAIASAGRMVAELPWLWMRPHHQGVLDRIDWEGAEHFEAGMRAGRGVIITSPHLGCWEIGAQAFAERYGPQYGPLVAMFRPPRKSWLVPLVSHSRARAGLETAPTSMAGIRLLVRTLRSGGYTALLPDQVPPEGQGVWAPWMGREAYTMTLLPRLVQQTGALVLMCWCERGTNGRFTLHIRPMEPPLPSGAAVSLQASATALNQAVEALVRSHPGQYLWGYARHKQPRHDA